MTLTASDLDAALAQSQAGWERDLRPPRPQYVQLDLVTRRKRVSRSGGAAFKPGYHAAIVGAE